MAVDTSQVSAVIAKWSTLLAENDPYNAVGSTEKPKLIETPPENGQPAETTPENGMPDPTKPVLKALPVEPAPERPVEVRRAEPVRPMDQVPEGSILKNTPPEALNPDDD